jgi:hypothetical protein
MISKWTQGVSNPEMRNFCSDQGRTRVCGEAYVCTPQPETRGLRLVEPTPWRENADQDKKGHLWMDTNYRVLGMHIR